MFANRVAIVTGASGGIGAAVGAAFAQAGAAVALLGRREEPLSRLADEIERHGGIAVPVRCDVADAAQANAAVNEVRAMFGPVDILINAAGVTIPAKVEDARLEDLREMMNINYFGVVHMVQAVLPHMKAQNFGHIVNIGSIAGRRGEYTLAGYCASKFALAGFTEALRLELFGTEINVSLINSSPVDTQMLDNPDWRVRSGILDIWVVPVDWVVSAVFAAIEYRLAEVDIPFGFGMIRRVASAFPDFFAPWYGFTTSVVNMFSQFISSASESDEWE
jgi:NADP-dependent 3-hydroxy acid dehydrogenase YdfG